MVDIGQAYVLDPQSKLSGISLSIKGITIDILESLLPYLFKLITS